MFEEAMKQVSNSVDNGYYDDIFDESLRVEETKTMENSYMESGKTSKQPVIKSSTPKMQSNEEWVLFGVYSSYICLCSS